MQVAAGGALVIAKPEGAILTADLLLGIAEGRPPGPKERLNEAINRASNRGPGAWIALQDGRRRRLGWGSARRTCTMTFSCRRRWWRRWTRWTGRRSGRAR